MFYSVSLSNFKIVEGHWVGCVLDMDSFCEQLGFGFFLNK